MKRISRKLQYNTGMTLVELLVVVSIFMIVSSLSIFDYGKFRSSVSLQNLADDIALSIRRAQNYAIGVHSSQSSTFYSGYGIHFSTATPSPTDAKAGSYKSFIIFSDLATSSVPPNKIYDYIGTSSSICNTSTLTSTNECIDLLNITSNDVIDNICTVNGGNETCLGPNSYVDITFVRPNPDAYICAGPITSFPLPCNSTASSVNIKIKNVLSNDVKTITVSNVGQISIH